jgi:hypothetical protein
MNNPQFRQNLDCGFFIYHYWCEAKSKSEKQPANLSIIDEAW